MLFSLKTLIISSLQLEEYEIPIKNRDIIGTEMTLSLFQELLIF